MCIRDRSICIHMYLQYASSYDYMCCSFCSTLCHCSELTGFYTIICFCIMAWSSASLSDGLGLESSGTGFVGSLLWSRVLWSLLQLKRVMTALTPLTSFNVQLIYTTFQFSMWVWHRTSHLPWQHFTPYTCNLLRIMENIFYCCKLTSCQFVTNMQSSMQVKYTCQHMVELTNL